jgi:hypothetical protein
MNCPDLEINTLNPDFSLQNHQRGGWKQELRTFRIALTARQPLRQFKN